MTTTEPLTTLRAGMHVPFGGDRVAVVDEELADSFVPGDSLVVVQSDGALLRIPAAERTLARDAVDRTVAASQAMATVDDAQVDDFFTAFATRLDDTATRRALARANEQDVASARERDRSTTRLVLDGAMLDDMAAGLRAWTGQPAGRGRVRRTIEHDGWTLEEVEDRLGVVAFVFEGRPNVFADACGVLRTGSTVVLRIGSDALGTARAIVSEALEPALAESGLPLGAVTLVDSVSRAAAWALFTDDRLALAVARGSGAAVAQLGAIARQSGVPVSLHGTGGAWMVAGPDADLDVVRSAVRHSLDRKVCNTLNTFVSVASRADHVVPAFLDGLEAAADARGAPAKLHLHPSALEAVSPAWRERVVEVVRADGAHPEPQAEPLPDDALGREWEWEESPEVTLAVAADLDEAVRWCNAQSPRLTASLVDEDEATQQAFFAAVEVPFVGDGLTRWVDGQFMLDTPELGLSNWEHGRLFARSGVLTGGSAHTVRYRARVHDHDLHR